MNIGEKLRQLRTCYGYSQKDLSRLTNTPQTSISNYEGQDELSGILEYIFKLCELIKIPFHEFFLNDVEQIKKDLPSYITPSDAAVLRILNTSIDIKARIEIKEAFLHIMKAVLVNYADKLGHMPEYRALFPQNTEYPIQEEKISSKVADKKDY